MLTQEQIEETKKKIIEQIDSSFPQDKKEQAIQQINEMTGEQLEEFLRKNSAENNKCIFCSIASGNSQSYKIAESEDAVAVLEINPISKGHSLILPKEHLQLEKISEEIKNFSKDVARKLQEKLNPKDIEIASLSFQGHGVINLIPVYTNESIKSERRNARKEELEEISKLFQKEEVIKEKSPEIIEETEKSEEEITEENTWLPKRIP